MYQIGFTIVYDYSPYFAPLLVFLRWCFLLLFLMQGYYKVLGKGFLPKQPVIVKAKFFSQQAEQKIKSAGGACVLVA